MVAFDKKKLKRFTAYKPFNQKLGISFTTSDDRKQVPDGYVHVKFINSDNTNIHFSRFPIHTLKLSKKNVPLILKEQTLGTIQDYFKFGYLDNLTYIEAIANVNEIKTQ